MTTSPRVKVTVSATDATYNAEKVEPFGPACLVLVNAWSLDYNGRFETAEDARAIIIPVPTGSEKIEITEEK